MDNKSEFKTLVMEPYHDAQLIEALNSGWKIISACGYMEEITQTGYVGSQQVYTREGYPRIQYVLERNQLWKLTYE